MALKDRFVGVLIILLVTGLTTNARSLDDRVVQAIIDSVHTTESTCPNNGTIEIFASGTPPFTHTITDGPICIGLTYPIAQGTVSLFENLCAGNYTVMVSDNSTDPPVNQVVTVAGNYILPILDLGHTEPLCMGGTDATLTATVTAGLGSFDFSVTGGTIVGSLTCTDCSAIESFTGLGAGTYKVVVLDTCGSQQTRMEIIPDVATNNVVAFWGDQNRQNPRRLDDCSTARYYSLVGLGSGTPGFSWEVYDNAGNLVGTTGGFSTTNTLISLDLPIANEPYRFIVIDTCGTIDSIDIFWTDNVGNINNDFQCTTFDINLTNVFSFAETITVTAVDTSGIVFTATIQGNEAEIDDIPYGSYVVTLSSPCGSKVFNVDEAPAVATFLNVTPGIRDLCLGHATARVNFNGEINRPYFWQFTNFPAMYNEDSFLEPTSGTWGANFNEDIDIARLHEGDYTLEVLDDCGNELTPAGGYEFTIVDTARIELEVTPTLGCGIGDGSIEWSTLFNNVESFFRFFSVILFDSTGSQVDIITNTLGPGTFTNLPSGTYELALGSRFGGSFLNVCDTLSYFVTIPEYVQPEFDPLFAVTCSDGLISILGSGVNGVPPYNFELYTGSQVPGIDTPIDSALMVLDFQFDNLPDTTSYKTRIVDDCGNGLISIASITGGLDLFITTICTPTSLTLKAPSIGGVTYSWTLVGDTAVLSTTNLITFPSQVTVADTGLYQVKVELSGCVTDSITYQLDAPSICSIQNDTVIITVFPGDSTVVCIDSLLQLGGGWFIAGYCSDTSLNVIINEALINGESCVSVTAPADTAGVVDNLCIVHCYAAGSDTLCDTTIVIVHIPCTRIDIQVLLEGPYIGAGMMRTDLNDNYLLPGQDLALNANPLANIIGNATPVGQPYNRSPWNYTGIEGDKYGDSTTNSHPDLVAYASDIVDWVLVLVRENDSLATSVIWRCAGLLHSDGEVEFPDECDCLNASSFKKYYLVVEHRNHLPMMTSSLQLVDGKLSYDFRIQDTWILELLPEFFLGVGQKNQGSDYMMYAGNGEQIPGTFDRRDVISGDNALWFSETDQSFSYRDGDYDMNTDVNPLDNVLWSTNAGVTGTRMPLNVDD